MSPFKAPYKHLPSNKSLRKNKTKTTTRTKQARKNKTGVVVVKKIWNSNAKIKPSFLYVY
ncbi:hypothetical protein BW899_16515 [Bacillus mycoides]|nr:hypothetical protein BW899_16515 [Bacillus mycoides]QWH86468.1 hypothetical protein EXW46_18655 [Bacillus mycoides]QWI40896.1 hypothetical protein EXW43_16755 [Bacillus mycoides]QWI63449.1 hypothetical protein EXW57_16150 [Bacillus mycoides]